MGGGGCSKPAIGRWCSVPGAEPSRGETGLRPALASSNLKTHVSYSSFEAHITLYYQHQFSKDPSANSCRNIEQFSQQPTICLLIQLAWASWPASACQRGSRTTQRVLIDHCISYSNSGFIYIYYNNHHQTNLPPYILVHPPPLLVAKAFIVDLYSLQFYPVSVVTGDIFQSDSNI